MTDPNEMAELRATLGPWLDQHSRPGWKPSFGSGDGDRPFGWYNATPPAGAGPTPTCGECEDPMELVLAVDLSGVPAELGHPLREGMVEVYYCNGGLDLECYPETWDPYAAGHHVRVVDPYGSDAGPTGGRVITGWELTTDRPDRDDLIELGAQISFGSDDFRFAVPDAGIDLDVGYGEHLDEVIGTPAQGDKLGGWPNWVQYRQHAACSTCGEELTHFYQLDDGGPHGLMFGDAGCAYVGYCRTHPEIMTLHWQCH